MARVQSDLGSEHAARRNRIATLVLTLMFFAVCMKLAWNLYGPVMGFVVCTPILGVYGAWFLVHRAEHWLFLPKWMALRKVHGRRHFFEDHPLQIEVSDGRCVIAAADIFSVLGIAPDAQLYRRVQLMLGEEGFSRDSNGAWWFEEAALRQWFEGRAAQPDRRMQKLQRWLETEALPALHRKLERGGAGSRSG